MNCFCYDPTTAIQNDHFDCLKRLCPTAEIASTKYFGGTPILHYVVKKQKMEYLTYFLDLGMDIEGRDAFKQTILHIASDKNATKIMEELIRRGANLNPEDIFGHTPLDNVVKNGQIEAIKILLFHGVLMEITNDKLTYLMNKTKDHKIKEYLQNYFDYRDEQIKEPVCD